MSDDDKVVFPADRDDWEPEIPVPRWRDGKAKPEKFWTEHERGHVAHAKRMRDEHRVAKGRQKAEKGRGNVTT